MKAVLHSSMFAALEADLADRLTTPWSFDVFADDAAAEVLREPFAAADTLITMAYGANRPPIPNVRLLQVAGAGIDLIDLALVPPGAAVCAAYGHDTSVAEYVVLAMLEWSHRLGPSERSFRAGSWEMSSRTGGPLRRDLAGSRVLVLGLGRIGRAVATAAAALGCEVTACTRTVRPAPPGVHRVVSLEALDEVVGRCDFLVVCAALVPETRGLVAARQLDLMASTAVVVNVARAPCVDEEALYDACREGRIGGAVIDTWYAYPTPAKPHQPPSRFPFAELDNVVMTPHVAAWTTGAMGRRLDEIASNLDRLSRDEPLMNVIRATSVDAEEQRP